MTSNSITIRKGSVKILAVYQIVGGILGLGLTAWAVQGLKDVTSLLVLILLIAVGLYSYSIYCGVLLLRGNPSGLSHSLVNQLLQLVSFSVFGFAFQYTSGVFFTIGVDLTNSLLINLNLALSQWQIAINDNKEAILFNFNLVAFLLIIFVERQKKKIRKERLESQITSIGEDSHNNI